MSASSSSTWHHPLTVFPPWGWEFLDEIFSESVSVTSSTLCHPTNTKIEIRPNKNPSLLLNFYIDCFCCVSLFLFFPFPLQDFLLRNLFWRFFFENGGVY